MTQFEENCEILESDELGRYLVAKRDLPRGQLIFEEKPIVIGPYWDSEICCLNCYGSSCTICRKCKRAPLCFDCVGHDEIECEFYRNSGLDINFLFDHFDVVTPVRSLLLAHSNRSLFDEMMAMEAHVDARRNTDIWNAHSRKVVQPLMESQAFQEMKNPSLTDELIQQICGFFDVNAFEIRGQMEDQNMQLDNPVRGLFLKAALMAHNCVSNTMISVDGNANLRLYTTVPVMKGEMLQYNYTRTLFGTFERRAHLKMGKYFVCKCTRCEDPTELGTHLSSVNCTGCDGGLCSYNAKEDRWTCHNCHQQLSGEYVKQVLVAARKDSMKCSADINELEQTIAKHSKTLNPRNSVVLELKQILAGELRHLCLSTPRVPREYLRRKFQLCAEMLEILRILEPGISRLTGIALYEYNRALWDLAKDGFESSQKKNTKDFLERLAKAEAGLKDSISMLLFEHPTTPEGQLTKRAMHDLKVLRAEIVQMQKMAIEEKEENLCRHNRTLNKKH